VEIGPAMPTIVLTLPQPDARLLYLAFIYHLARPGSELDRETRQPLEHGLLEVARALHAQLNAATASLELSEGQLRQLTGAILGTINELKVYPMLDAAPPREGGGRRTVVAGFDATLRTLFPQVQEEPDATLDLAARLIVLRRRIDAARAQADTQREVSERPASSGSAPKRRWRIWRRQPRA